MLGLFASEWSGLMPFGVGFGVAVALSSMLWLITRRPAPVHSRRPSSKQANVLSDSEDDTYANRRSSSRREGTPVRVIISSPAFRGQMETGWVLDRSTGGLRIAVKQPMAAGSVLQVRAENAPDTIPWTSVIIRSCRDEGPHHEIGCSFEQTPPWNVLLLFG